MKIFIKFALCAILISIGVLPCYGQQSGEAKETSTAQSYPYKRNIVREGLNIELTIEHHSPTKDKRAEFREDDDTLVSFKITDEQTGAPVNKANPAAWMDRTPDGAKTDPGECKGKVELFVGGGLMGQAEHDLNVYYVLAMNEDSTITVVDPLFGFGGTKLLALVPLKSPAEDWALTSDQNRLFVSTPDSNQVAIIDTVTWQVTSTIEAGPRPGRLAFQPDEAYLWAGYQSDSNAKDSGVTVIDSQKLTIAARISTGGGSHQIAFSEDSRFAFVTNRKAGTVSVIDIRTLKKIADIKTGTSPQSISYSNLARAVYVTDDTEGTIVVIDEKLHREITRMKAEPGLGQIRFAPGGRLGFVVNPEKNLIHILDASLNRVIQTADIADGPDQVAFSTELAYLRLRSSESILMIPLSQIGKEGAAVPVVDFPGGQAPLGKTVRPSPADAIVQAAGENAVLVANPADKMIYYYREGMAAPMGNFSNYGRQPRAVLIVDRSLRERAPGLYQTEIRLRRAGNYQVAFFMSSPRIINCFDFTVAPNPELSRNENPPPNIEPLNLSAIGKSLEKVRLTFKLTDPRTSKPVDELKDLNALIFAPGVWQTRQSAEHVGGGVYAIEFTPPMPGIYYVHLACFSREMNYTQVQAVTVIEAKPGEVK